MNPNIVSKGFFLSLLSHCLNFHANKSFNWVLELTSYSKWQSNKIMKIQASKSVQLKRQ